MATGGLVRWDWHRAAPGHTFYLPEFFYFYDLEDRLHRPRDFPIAAAALVTARCLARWSDAYWATPSFHRTPAREGPLPERPEEREAFVEALFRWFEEVHPQGGEQERRLSKMEPQAGWPATPTAFQALQTSLPALRRLHGEGYVWQLISEGARADRPIARWSVSVWLPSEQQSLSYRMINGVLFGPGIELRIDARDTPPIWPFEQEGPPELLDSDAALRQAEAAGGRAFRERTGAGLGELRLHGRDDGSLVWVASYGRWYPHVGLRIWLDARTGAAVATREDPQPPPAAA